jgi:RNA polymerase sigma factor (sigma-70 family)
MISDSIDSNALNAQTLRRSKRSKTDPRDTEPTLTEEKPILERIAEGDQAAVGDFINRYGDLVWSLARRYLGNHPDAEDAVQEIFIEIWNVAGRYDSNVASEVAFISTITRRRLIDRLRSFERKPGMESIDDQIGAKQPAVAAGLNDDAEVAQVERVLGDMEPQHRQILAMSLYQGYSHSEIAERLDMPLGTVKTRVRRGLIHVREQLKIAEELDDSAKGATA